jgi:competence protein ComEC
MSNQLVRLYDLSQDVKLNGIVATEPVIQEKSQKVIVKFGNEKFLITTSRYPEYNYGDELEITGKLETPSEDINGFNYKEYLKKDGIYYVMGFPNIKYTGQNSGNVIIKVLYSFKNKFKEVGRQYISPPQEGFLEALIFGDEENIPQLWKDKLNLTGTRHITAVSGMNITIISFLILNFLLLIGLWRQQAFYLTIFLLILYILMIGAPASAIRAGVMAGILLLAQYLGRLAQAQRAVVFAATAMLFINPFLLKLDVGFQLSFLAILGIIYFQPFFSDLFKKIPNPKLFPIKTTLSATLSAQIFTLPILIYNFGYIPLTSPFTNILIVPFLAPITILIFIFGLSGMILGWLAYILSFPVWLCLAYLTKVIDLFSKIPFASLKLENMPWVILIIFYLILIILIWRLQERQKLKFLNY